MTSFELAELSFKVLATYLVVSGIITLSGVLLAQRVMPYPGVMSGVGSALATALGGLAIWVGSKPLAARSLPCAHDAVVCPSASIHGLVVAGTIVIGLGTIGASLPQLGSDIVSGWPGYWSPSVIKTVLGDCIKPSVGFCLIVLAGPIGTLASKANQRGDQSL